MLESVKQFSEDTAVDADVWAAFARGLYYVAGDIGDAALYSGLARTGGGRKRAATRAERAVLPIDTAQPVRASGLGLGAAAWQGRRVAQAGGGETVRHDLASARELSGRLHEVFNESDVYRIDHTGQRDRAEYSGVPVRQRDLRTAVEPAVREPRADHGAESIGVEGRGAYYQEAGALADMIQNHMLQVMATIAMEPVASFRATSVRDEKSKLLRSMRAMTPDEVRQNSVPGNTGRRVWRAGDRGVPAGAGVDAQSPTDTYAAVTFFVENWRWRACRSTCGLANGCPSASPRSPSNSTGAAHIFDADGGESAPNLLIVRIQPEEGIR